jgi:glutamate synthase (NADPH/NADH) small chain
MVMDITASDRKRRMALPDQRAPTRDPMERRHNWEEICLGFDVRQAMAESERCIRCPAAPCQKACPLHNDIRGAMESLESGDVLGAADRFRVTSPMPDVCGRICPQERLCEGSCVLGKRGVPVRIGQIERFVSDVQRAERGVPPIVAGAPTGRSVAIVGAGPAGLAAAEELRRRGHRVKIFDAWPLAGGVLRYGIPTFKLPEALIAAKQHQLEAAGVEIATAVTIGAAGDLATLRSDGFDAVLLAIGAGAPTRLGVPGEDLASVWSASDFLVRANLPPSDLPPAAKAPLSGGERVVVIGGGDTAMDCCRTAVRHGAPDVVCLYRRSEAEMPGRREERAYARDEGVQFAFLAAPVRLLGENGVVTGIDCTRLALGEPDGSGRRRVTPIPDALFYLPATTVVVAAGYHVDEKRSALTTDLVRQSNGTIMVDPDTGATSLPGVFAAGDVVNGPDLVVTALAAGCRAARGIDAYLAR